VFCGSLFLGFGTYGLSFFLTWPHFVVDAGLIANRLERGEVVGPWQFF
jgi:hypothetical protein